MRHTKNVAALLIATLTSLQEVGSFRLLPKVRLHRNNSSSENMDASVSAAAAAATAAAARPAWDAEAGSWVDNKAADFDGEIPSPLCIFG